MKKVLILTMGGTIDALPYSEVDGEYPPDATMSDGDHAFMLLQEIFAEAVGDQFFLTRDAICKKDSKEINDRDIKRLTDYISRSKGFDRIIVTVGTDRMKEIALHVERNIPDFDCPVIFTGAIWPITNKKKSDGPKNLETAATAEPSEPGVYIAMGDVFDHPAYVEKDYQRKRFVALPHPPVAIPR